MSSMEAAAPAESADVAERGEERNSERNRGSNRSRSQQRRGRSRSRSRRRSGDRDRRRSRSRDRDRRDRRSRDRRSRDRRSRDRRSRSRGRRGGNSLQDELRQDRGEDYRAREEKVQEEPRRRKSKWGEEDQLAAAGVPDWLRDQFVVPVVVPEPTVGAGQRKVKVPQQCVGRILGKMGSTINEIQDASNTDIKLNQDTKDAGYSYAIVTSTTGDEAALDKAEQMITEKIAGAPPVAARPLGMPPPFAPVAAAAPMALPGQETKEIFVDKCHVGRLIGKGGEYIRSMTNDAGCNIQIDQNQPGEQALVSIGPGTLEQVAKAEELVHAKIAERSNQSKPSNPMPVFGGGAMPCGGLGTGCSGGPFGMGSGCLGGGCGGGNYVSPRPPGMQRPPIGGKGMVIAPTLCGAAPPLIRAPAAGMSLTRPPIGGPALNGCGGGLMGGKGSFPGGGIGGMGLSGAPRPKAPGVVIPPGMMGGSGKGGCG